MAAKDGRSLEQTPTWAVAVVCFVLVAISLVIEHIIHLTGKWLTKRNKKALHEALEKIKSELMLLGFFSLLLTVGQGLVSSEICVSKAIGNSWHPCDKNHEKSKYGEDTKAGGNEKCTEKGKVPFVSSYALQQLHKFIFVLAVSHVVFSLLTLALARAKMSKWKSWETETRTLEYQYSHDPERFRFARDTSFGRRHLSSWSRSPALLWVVSFFRQFFRSVLKVDYLTLRHGFIVAHLAPQSQANFDFQNYIKRSLEEDFKVVVGISPPIWFSAVLFLLFNTHGWNSHLWMPFVPFIILLLVGTKLQVIITEMGLTIQERGEVVKGSPVVQPGDDLFWFNRPHLLLYLIHFVLFQNAFQLAFFVYSWYEFGMKSCFHGKTEDIAIKISMGVLVQILCSYVTLPLYALVTQMGSNMRPTIFNERVAKAIRSWHQTARMQIKKNRHSDPMTPTSSRPSTPLHGSSPVHLLRYHSYELDSVPASPRISHHITKPWQAEQDDASSSHKSRDVREMAEEEINVVDFSFDKYSGV